jgi:hypothetical protein
MCRSYEERTLPGSGDSRGPFPGNDQYAQFLFETVNREISINRLFQFRASNVRKRNEVNFQAKAAIRRLKLDKCSHHNLNCLFPPQPESSVPTTA